MAASSSSNPNPGETSYIEMSKTRAKNAPSGGGGGSDDPFLIGKHCELEFCNQLDFLPFQCQSCSKIFCSDHRSEESHKCAKAGAWAERRRKANAATPSIGEGRSVRDRDRIAPGSTCAGTSCKMVIGTSLNTGVRCDGCREAYCLKHRLREEHGCAARAAARKKEKDVLGVDNAMDQFKTRWNNWVSTQKTKNRGFFSRPAISPAAKRIKMINELKKSAKGDAKLPAEKRVYLVVAASEKNGKGQYPKDMFFYSRDWVVGRMLDEAAKSMGVENVNNTSNQKKDKLAVFHAEKGNFLAYSDKVGVVLENGQRVILTRGGLPPDEVIAKLMA